MQSSIMIRVATPLDVEHIAKLHVRTWQAAYRGHMPDSYLDGLDSSNRAAMWSRVIVQTDTLVLVATTGDVLVGFCSLLPSRDPDGSAAVGEIAAIYVEPSVWRSGIGSSLVEGIVESARERSFSEVTLWVLASNTVAHAFYEARGFLADGNTKIEERSGFSIHEVRYRRSIAA